MAGVQGNIRSFIEPVKGAGRTAPALLQDLTLHSPWQATPTKQYTLDLLAESPIHLLHAQSLGELLPHDSCRHEFYLKPKQSRLPLLDERPGPDTTWIAAVFCGLCRLHYLVKVDYRVRFKESPCPNAEHPLHHLVRSQYQESLERSNWERLNPSTDADIYTYQCSSPSCSATVSVHVCPRIIGKDLVHILVDPDLLRQRTEDAFREKAGNTEGMKHPTPTDVLSDLRAYIRNSWRAKEDSKFRSINLSNRRFIVRFGPAGTACKDVLEHLGFRLDGDCWMVPEPDEDVTEPFQTARNIFIDNVEHELSSIIATRPMEEKQNGLDLIPLRRADEEIARVLSCQKYDTHQSSRTNKTSAESRTPPFVALGIPMDVSDELVVNAYYCQMETDVQNAPIYLTNLGHIAKQRQSDILETAVAVETSQGRFDLEQLNQAYKALQLTGRESMVTDQDILGTFDAVLTDFPKHERDLREYLRIIGVHRNSKMIMSHAQNVISDYETALDFLGAKEYHDDDQITALYAAKVNDNKSLQDQANQAARIIAQSRNSHFLSSWIDSGFGNTMDQIMDPAEGYQILQIQHREIEDEMIIMQYDSLVDEYPANAENYYKALTAIANGRASSVLLDHLHSKAPQLPVGTLEEPVGLENIGNTCYLNSLLQFFFTMVELRQIVLDFDRYKMSLEVDDIERKRVGHRKVSLKEVETAQKFVASLASLFRGMIASPLSSIRPEQELARLTLESENVKEKIRRRSTIQTDRPSLGQTDGLPFFGPLTQPSPRNDETNTAILQSPVDESVTNPFMDVETSGQELNQQAGEDGTQNGTDTIMNDNSSEVTLVSKSNSEEDPENTTKDEQQSILDNKENLSPINSAPPPDHMSMQTKSEPLAPASPSRLNAQAGGPPLTTSTEEHSVQQEQITYLPPPGKPPPVPPRNPLENTTTKLEEYAKQQDVTEVIEHVLNQLSSAIRPTGIDNSGEQQDEVHDLFYGQLNVHYLQEKETVKTEQFRNIITRIYNKPSDVYAAIDNAYDLQRGGNEINEFTSITRLPPVLSISFDRVVWNNVSKRSEKSNHHVQTPETIYMDRYLESPTDSDLMQRRRQTWDNKQELSALSARRAVLEQQHGQSKDMPTLLEDAKLVLERLAEIPADSLGGGLDIDPKTISNLGTLADNARAELEGIVERMENLNQHVKEAFADMRKHAYRLHAAFFHRGNAGGGHYWVYIYDHKKEIWRKYNDDRVTIVDNRNEIFGAPVLDQWGSPPPNPYLLVYVKAESVNDIVETVKRDIVYPPPDGPPPVPARDQISAMPPTQSQGDVEMVEYVNGGEQAQDPFPDIDMELSHSQPLIQKEGQWNDSELTADRKIKW